MRSRAVLLAIVMLVAAVPSWGQYTRPGRSSTTWKFQEQSHRVEILGFGGYMWSGSEDVWYGDLTGEIDLKDSGVWGIEADIAVRPGAQLVLLYHRQDTELEFRSWPDIYLAGDIAVEHWHIGGMSGVQRGNVMPFGLLTVGGTRIVPKFEGGGDDVWKFSVIFGLGAKFYVSDRVGVRVQGLLPWIFTEGGGGIACGSGGCFTSFGGSGIIQGEVSGGLFIMF
jgi:hypothetical protein